MTDRQRQETRVRLQLLWIGPAFNLLTLLVSSNITASHEAASERSERVRYTLQVTNTILLQLGAHRNPNIEQRLIHATQDDA